jgi:hypothetical protein
MKSWAVGAGVVVVVGTHIYLLNNSLPDSVKQQHAILNLAAAGLIVYGLM